jgi:hypothetical protein
MLTCPSQLFWGNMVRELVKSVGRRGGLVDKGDPMRQARRRRREQGLIFIAECRLWRVVASQIQEMPPRDRIPKL